MNDWFKPKGYSHFDPKILKEDFKKIQEKVSDPSFIKSHPFYPLISYDKTKYKIVVDPWGTRSLDTTGKRTISYAAHVDAHVYAFYSKLLYQRYEDYLLENGISKNVIAFRKLETEDESSSKCNIHLANDAFETIKKMGTSFVAGLDISGFFDNISHKQLHQNLKRVLKTERLPDDWQAVFKHLTSYRYVEFDTLKEIFGTCSVFKSGKAPICSPSDFRKIVRKKIKTKTTGIPQGLPISAILANLYMIDFDIAMEKFVSELGGCYFRYCDDLLFVIPDLSFTENKINKIVSEKLKEFNLELSINAKKTESCSFIKSPDGISLSGKAIQYLGFTFDGKQKRIRQSSLSNFRRKAKLAINKTKRIAAHHNKDLIASGAPPQPVFTKKLYRRYTNLGGRNFVTYGLKAAEVMESEAIRLQIKRQNKWATELIRELNETH